MMTSSHLQLEKNLVRSLERLQHYSQHKSLQQLLPAFSYTANQLDNYLKNQQSKVKRVYYYQIYEAHVSHIQQKIKQSKDECLIIKKPHKRAIFDDILGLVAKYKDEHMPKKDAKTLKMQKQQKMKKQFNCLQKQIVGFYEQHNLDFCNIKIQQLYKIVQQNQQLQVLFTSQLQLKLNKIVEQYQKMLVFYNYFNEDDWIFDKQEDQIKLYYKVFQQERTISVKIFAQIDMEMLPFLAIACEIDLQNQYVPFVYVSQQTRVLARNKRVGYSKTYVPLLKDRECFFYAVGYDRIKTTGSIFIYTESFQENLDFQKEYDLEVEKENEFVRLKVHYFCLDYRPLLNGKAEIRLVTKANFKLTFMPLIILQKTARIFTFDYFRNVVEKAKHYQGSQWQKKVQQNPAMYKFFQNKISQYFK